MPKPIGNLTANLKQNDKVSSKLLAKFQSPRDKPPVAGTANAPASKPVKKYKKRKR